MKRNHDMTHSRAFIKPKLENLLDIDNFLQGDPYFPSILDRIKRSKHTIQSIFAIGLSHIDKYRKYSGISSWAYFRENTVIKRTFNLNYIKDKK
jgi:hypothetical protein